MDRRVVVAAAAAVPRPAPAAAVPDGAALCRERSAEGPESALLAERDELLRRLSGDEADSADLLQQLKQVDLKLTKRALSTPSSRRATALGQADNEMPAGTFIFVPEKGCGESLSGAKLNNLVCARPKEGALAAVAKLTGSGWRTECWRRCRVRVQPEHEGRQRVPHRVRQ